MATPDLTAPVKTSKLPPGIPFIIGNEAAERFSYYGMQSILVVFMMNNMLDAQGRPDHMSEAQANAWFHTFVSLAYILPVLGAFLADAVLGKFKTVLILSIVYCFGHFALAINDTRSGLAIGLGLIALGAGGIKPCVSAIVGDQFTASNQHLLSRVYSWFYFSINFGSAFSTILIPELLHRYGPKVAFGTPGIFMVIATIIFWFGRRKFVRVPPAGVGNFMRELGQKENLKALGNLLIIVPFAAMFWALWEQNFSSWVVQADKMDRHLFGHEWLPSQIQTVNPIFILLLLPLFSYVIYPLVNKVFTLTPLRKIGIGLFGVAGAFVLAAWIQNRIDHGQTPNIIWQIVGFLILTAAEVMVSVTHLEFAYTQAPKKMKSLVMCTYLGAVALGNVFTALVNVFIQNPDGTVKLQGASYFMFFAEVMLVTAVLFVIVSGFYRGKTCVPDASENSAA
ncbi:MAG TPA: POT family MFS transporter [Candidatus Paceibacterota bacterium]|nr:POT family MFS transporter [Candidatus Paceibacterota bacterium]